MQNFLNRLTDLFTTLLGVGGTSSPLVSLDRSIGAAGQAHTAARRALAVAIAEEAREIERRETLADKVANLETRAVLAIRAGRDDLAEQAADAIAALSNEVDASRRASQRFAAEVALARREVDAQRRRLAQFDRGRRLAKVGHALNSVAPDQRNGLDSFAAAEASLEQIVAPNDDARAIREELAPPAERLIEHLADAGFGEPVRIRAIDIMSRLKIMAAEAPPTLIQSTTRS